jgi:hypothetical protein
VLFFFGWQLFVFVGCHSCRLAHSLRLTSSNAITRSTFPAESKTRTHLSEAGTAQRHSQWLASDSKIRAAHRHSRHLRGISEGSDFDDCHLEDLIFLQPSIYVHLSVNGSNNGESLSHGRSSKPKRHTANRCLFGVREQIINGLVWNKSISSIARALHVSRNTVAAIRDRGG